MRHSQKSFFNKNLHRGETEFLTKYIHLVFLFNFDITNQPFFLRKTTIDINGRKANCLRLQAYHDAAAGRGPAPFPGQLTGVGDRDSGPRRHDMGKWIFQAQGPLSARLPLPRSRGEVHHADIPP